MVGINGLDNRLASEYHSKIKLQKRAFYQSRDFWPDVLMSLVVTGLITIASLEYKSASKSSSDAYQTIPIYERK